MPFHNVTVEDSSPIVVYRNYSQWIDSKYTPSDYSQYSGPSDRFNSNHNTSEVATVDFAFNGSTIYVFGSTGPTHGPFTATLIPNNNFPPVTDYSLTPMNSIENTTSETKYKQVIYSRTGLDQSVPHLLSLTNQGESLFILDYFIVEAAVPGSSVSEYILDDSNPNFSFNGNWSPAVSNFEKNDGGQQFFNIFNNNTNHYTEFDGDNMVLRLNGSGVAVHGTWYLGTFLAALDDQEPVHINSTRYPMGSITRPREMIYYADNLGEKEHILTLINGPLNGRLGCLNIDYAVIITTNLDSVPKGITANTTITDNSRDSKTKDNRLML
ncbi:hypothetical protein M422DRAFT_271233 [Sphaerobolus stellatus SS14]|uniref:Uncharacterized protein n=1 Tax=Sphaerobolus stellatus (strain SS14) TaxID=990650 RepID=A0A0C9U0P3_SPHS4|nr:hypothetical protein M422DRAFT_271233 [Sphaerobolus stellatus SS14]